MADRNAANDASKTTGTSSGSQQTGMGGATKGATEGGSKGSGAQGGERDFGTEFEALKHDLAQVRRDLSNLASVGVSTATDTASSARDSAANMMDRVRGAGSSAMDSEGEMMDAMRGRIGEHPMSAMAMALGLGFLAGWIVSNR